MHESIQEANVMKPLGSVAAYILCCFLLRCMLALLAVGLSVILSSCSTGFKEGLVAYDRGDYTTALQHWQFLAEQGDARAQYYLGYMYETARGVPKDNQEALEWYGRASGRPPAMAQNKLGVQEAVREFRSNAQYELGSMYETARGVPKDDQEAAKWFRKAAEQGYALAQTNLGYMYATGRGVPQDDIATYVWYTLAITGGNKAASRNREKLTRQMPRSEIAEAERQARNWEPSKEQTQTPSTAKAQNQKRVTPTSTVTQHQRPSTSTQALPPILSFEDITLSENVLDAEETITLAIRIKNVGPGDARNLKLQLSGNLTGLTFPKTIDVPTIPKNSGEKTVNVNIRGDLNLPTATAAIDIHLNEPHFNQRIQGKRLTFGTRAFRKPELSMADAAVLENTSAAPNNRIDLNEMIDLKFYVQNRGVGTAEQVKVQVSNAQTGVMWLWVTHQDGLKNKEAPTFPKIDPGKFELVTYTYLVNSEFTDTELRFNIRATERHGRWGCTGTEITAINTELAPLGTITELPRENSAPRQRPRVEELPALEIDVRKDIPETPTKNPNAVAVVIGNRNYTNPGVPDVAYAENDALIVKQYLITTLGYREENIHYHIDATKGTFERLFGNRETYKGRLYDYIDPNGSSDIFIYYSGHGAPDIDSKQPYLVPTDANPSTVEIGGYALKQLYLNLTKVPYRSATVVIDSCFSGMSASGALIPGAKGYGIPSIEIPLLPPKKSVIFTATNKRQVANGYRDKQHSLFTYFFLKALRGDADASGDNRLTVREIETYINKHVPRTSRRVHGSSREQTPQVEDNKSLVVVRY